MHYVTIKTELWSHMEGGAEDYYRYEVITRVRNIVSGENRGKCAWKTTILSVDRVGDVSNLLQEDGWRETFGQFAPDVLTEHIEESGSMMKARKSAHKQHSKAVELLMA